jgi:hypothetical protein
MQTHTEPQASAGTPSQQFIAALGYQGQTTAEEAMHWHYQAIKRLQAFTRHDNGQRTDSFALDMLGEAPEHEEVLLQCGISDPGISIEQLNAPLPEDVSELVWKWLL